MSRVGLKLGKGQEVAETTSDHSKVDYRQRSITTTITILWTYSSDLDIEFSKRRNLRVGGYFRSKSTAFGRTSITRRLEARLRLRAALTTTQWADYFQIHTGRGGRWHPDSCS